MLSKPANAISSARRLKLLFKASAPIACVVASLMCECQIMAALIVSSGYMCVCRSKQAQSGST